ncbi:ATP-dependent zinc metalloprotease FtsH [Breznakia pachnodae]|uniref:ATP-dependent zinc metalloprotease FtsH n=1 Tax=Breznakia pachnodae TaxID=265178 RepID=A0ABU0E0A2_9FIRM|nr:ATP-dependent zinc metalloprotease FtsH [Breznakia pachnodae]MDQ0360240.1 cell division protease FtsH [Breznakia pachnodae]
MNLKKMNRNRANNNDNNYRQSQDQKTRVPRGPNLFNILLVFFMITCLFNILFPGSSETTAQQITYSQFIELVETEQVDSATISDSEIMISLDKDASKKEVKAIVSNDDIKLKEDIEDTKFITERVDDEQLVTRLTENNVDFSQTKTETASPIISFISAWILPMIIMYLIYYFMIRSISKRMGKNVGEGGGMGGFSQSMNIGKSKAKEYNVEKNTGVTFKDVAGQDEAKDSLNEMVDYLHDPKKYQKIGAKQPKGALLVGPPGTGKTLLAKAVAGEAKVPFYSISGSEFVEMFVGVGASRVRDLFKQAKKNAPCIIFIDEIDAIGKSRDNAYSQNDEREQTLNQLLAEMDGFDSNNGIIVLAATNRPEILDKALLRPGRFDRRIIVERPDLIGRESILKVHAKNVKMSPVADLHKIALATSGATGADLANMINEAALLAVKENRELVEQKDLMEAVEVVIAGKEKKDRIMGPEERKIVSYHEVGHALVSALQKNAQPVQKITIVPRTMGSLGYTMNMPEEEKYLNSKSEMLAQITVLLGGRAAEQIKFGDVTTGASNDIERATKLARSMVTQYGMSDELGPVALETTTNQYLSAKSNMNCSEETSTLIDKEVKRIVSSCEEEAIKLLSKNIENLDKISEFLLEKENITGEEFMELLNQ